MNIDDNLTTTIPGQPDDNNEPGVTAPGTKDNEMMSDHPERDILDVINETVAGISSDDIEDHLRRTLRRAGYSYRPPQEAVISQHLIDEISARAGGRRQYPEGFAGWVTPDCGWAEKKFLSAMKESERITVEARAAAEQITSEARDEALSEAAKIVREAREQAQRIVSHAEEQAQRIVEVASARGPLTSELAVTSLAVAARTGKTYAMTQLAQALGDRQAAGVIRGEAWAHAEASGSGSEATWQESEEHDRAGRANTTSVRDVMASLRALSNREPELGERVLELLVGQRNTPGMIDVIFAIPPGRVIFGDLLAAADEEDWDGKIPLPAAELALNRLRTEGRLAIACEASEDAKAYPYGGVEEVTAAHAGPSRPATVGTWVVTDGSCAAAWVLNGNPADLITTGIAQDPAAAGKRAGREASEPAGD
jgi:hypothetical protein